MGKALAGTHAAARRIFEEADDALGFPISHLCFEGPEAGLKLTEKHAARAAHRLHCRLRGAQRAGLYARLRRRPQPGGVFGAGGGGKSAIRRCRAAGPQARQYMQEAVPPGVGAMAALLKLPEGKLDGVLEQAAQGEVVSAANLEFAGPDCDRGPCGSRGPRHGAGQGRGRAPRRAPARQRAVPLRAHEARAGSACEPISTPPISATSPGPW